MREEIAKRFVEVLADILSVEVSEDVNEVCEVLCQTIESVSTGFDRKARKLDHDQKNYHDLLELIQYLLYRADRYANTGLLPSICEALELYVEKRIAATTT